MMKKKVMSVILILILLLTVTACGNSQKDVYEQNRGQTDAEDGIGADDMDTDGKSDAGDGGGQEIEQKPEPVKKDLSGELTVRMLNPNAVKTLSEEFTKLYPKVKFTFIKPESFDCYEILDFEKQLAVDLMSGNAADIVDAHCFDYPKVGRNGLLCDLYEFMENDTEFRKEDYFTNIFEALEVDGKLYGIPLGFDITTIWLSKQVTDLLNLDMSQYSAVTGKQILTMYEEAQATGLLPEGFVLDRYGTEAIFTLEQTYQYDRIARTASFDTPEYVDFLKRTQAIDVPEGGWCADPRDSSLDNRFPKGENYFFFYDMHNRLDGVHFASVGMENEQWNRPLGYISGDGRQAFNAVPLAISNSPNKELAWEFLKYCISEKDRADYGKMYDKEKTWYMQLFTSGVPINRANCRSFAEYMALDNVDESVYDRYVELAESCNFHNTFTMDLSETWGVAYGNFWKELITAEDCAKQLQERTETYFKE